MQKLGSNHKSVVHGALTDIGSILWPLIVSFLLHGGWWCPCWGNTAETGASFIKRVMLEMPDNLEGY